MLTKYKYKGGDKFLSWRFFSFRDMIGGQILYTNAFIYMDIKYGTQMQIIFFPTPAEEAFCTHTVCTSLGALSFQVFCVPSSSQRPLQDYDSTIFMSLRE